MKIKINYFQFVSFLFILINLLLCVHVFNPFQQTYYFPWLISQGILPYRDFFDQHGPLLFYFLVPFALDKSLSLLLIINLLIKTVTLGLSLKILMKTGSKVGFFLGGLLVLLLNYYATSTLFWYENFITVFFLIAYLLLDNRKKNKALSDIGLGVMLFFTTLLKPTAIIFLIPFALFTSSRKPIVTFLFCWALLFSLLNAQGSLFKFVENVFIFNRAYLDYHLKIPLFFYEKSFCFFSIILFVTTVSMAVLENKIKRNLLMISIVILSSIFLFPQFVYQNLPPIVTFFSIFTGSLLGQLKNKVFLCLLVLTLFYTGFLLKKNIAQFHLNKSVIAYQNNHSINQVIDYLNKERLSKRGLYVLGNDFIFYYRLGQYPPTYLLETFPWQIDYYGWKIVMRDLEKNHVKYIIKPKEIVNLHGFLNGIERYISLNFYQVYSNNEFIIYKHK